MSVVTHLCDRCSETFQGMDHYKSNPLRPRSFFMQTSDGDTLDLCESCAKKFTEWMEANE